MALIIFWILWRLRLQRQRAGYLFSLYLLCAGFERLLIQKIRVNPRYELLGAHLTQAELISLLLVIAGLAGVLGDPAHASAVAKGTGLSRSAGRAVGLRPALTYRVFSCQPVMFAT